MRTQESSESFAQKALDAMEDIFDRYDLPDEAQQKLGDQYQVFASNALIRFGELHPDVGYAEHNGEG